MKSTPSKEKAYMENGRCSGAPTSALLSTRVRCFCDRRWQSLLPVKRAGLAQSTQAPHHIHYMGGAVYDMADMNFLFCFVITSNDLNKVVHSGACSACKTSTTRNKFHTSLELTKLVILPLLTLPCRWTDVFYVFHKYLLHLRELAQERLHCFICARRYLMSGPLQAYVVEIKARTYASAIRYNSCMLHHCIGFIDGMVRGIARPGCSAEQSTLFFTVKTENMCWSST